MVTRRTKQTKRMRKGGDPFTRFVRRATGTNIFGPSTSLLAREIYAMIGPKGIKPYRQGDFENLMIHHPRVNKGHLLRDLRKLGMTDAQEYEVVANLEYIIPSRIQQYETNV